MNAEPTSGSSVWRRDLALTVLALVLLVAWDAGQLDLSLNRWFGTEAGFPWKDRWLTAGLLHEGGRRLATVMVLALLAGIWWPLGPARRLSRGDRVWWLATTLACMAVIPLLKQGSLTSCPWDLQEFGGPARWVSHWAWGVGDGGSGRCFPSGHASAAFAFLAGWFALRGPAPMAARIWLAGVWVLGALYGGAQIARGAHYLSHVLWTAWICWSLSALSHHFWQAWKVRRRGAAVAAP